MKVTAKSNYLHISPRKARAVAGAVKDMSAQDALARLRFVPNRAAAPLSKLIKSAVANAEHNFSLAVDGLRIAEFRVDGGPVFKRHRPASKGRVSPVKRRTSHVTLVLEGERTATARREKKTEVVFAERDQNVSAAEAARDEKKDAVFKTEKKSPSRFHGFVRRMFRRKSI